MSIYSSSRKERRGSRLHLGHLKLSIIEDSGVLVVQIFEARGLQRKEGVSLDTYVKIYILPDPDKRSKAKTRFVRQRDPIFNAKFPFVLTEKSHDKTLFISVWTHQITARNEMLGCMSFRIADLIGSKNINGWYQVLDQVKGRMESAQVPTSISKYEATISKYENIVPRGHKVFGVTIMKSQKGYGFSVYEKNPVYMMNVIPELPAANADLRYGDIILEVEGTDVRSASGPQVVDIVRSCKLTLHMVVDRAPISRLNLRHRSNTQRSNQSSFLNPFNSLTRNRSKSHMSVAIGNDQPLSGIVAGVEMDVPQPGPMTKRHRYSANYSSQSYLLPEFHSNPYFAKPPVSSPPLASQPSGPPPSFNNVPYVTRGYEAPGALSQPATVLYVPPPSGADMQLRLPAPSPSSSGNWNGTESHGRGLNMPDAGIYMGGTASQGYHSYGSSMVVNSSTRRGIFRANSSVTQTKEERSLSPDKNTSQLEVSALSQGNELPLRDFSLSAGFMRAPLQLKPPPGAANHHRVPSLTQYDEHSAGEKLMSGHSPFTRTASLSPYHAVAMAPYRNRHSNRMLQQQSSHDTSSPSPEGDAVGGLSDDGESLPVEWESLTLLEQKRQEVISDLLMAEQELVENLKAGLEAYYLPLKTILTEEVHQMIFLAIPEMLQYSSAIVDHFKLRQVSYTTPVSTAASYVNAVGEMYASKFPAILGNLRIYIQNFQVARQEIALSFTNESFTKLVQESVEKKGLATIYAFVEAGKDYLQKMSKAMLALLYLTPLSHRDHGHLSGLVEALLPLMPDREAVRKLEEDKEAMKKKQVCVGFGPKMHAFPILVPGRFLIHEGEVVVLERKKKKKVWLMLFSDILLMTRRNGRIFTCTEQPLLLEDMIISDINCTEPTDFQVLLVEGTFSRLIRAGSVEIREEWLEKLRLRVCGKLSNKRKAAQKRGQHHDHLKKQSQVLAATLAVDTEPEVVSHNLMTPIPESVAGSSSDKKTMEAAKSKNAESSLRRGISKRRSLFSSGRKVEQKESSSEASDRPAKGKTKKKSTVVPPTSKPSTPEESLTLDMIPVDILQSWERSFNSLLIHSDGIKLFEVHLKSEFSEENIQFWKACERFKTLPDHQIEAEAAVIYEEFIDPQASKLVNIDHQITRGILQFRSKPIRSMFQEAQQSIYLLMARDSFVRFIKSEAFQAALKR